jgi:inorganic pyrophosphatase
LDVGPDPPEVLHAYIEITPFDLMKYEVDKVSGYLRVDRPQRSSSQHPTLYGFVPRTYCGERVRRLAPRAKRGDGDPLDICVLSERAIARNEIIVRGRVIGGLQMIDGGEADDKIISVLENDYVWGGARNVSDVPPVLVERLQHYFLTYKLVPGQRAPSRIASVYGRVHALKVSAVCQSGSSPASSAWAQRPSPLPSFSSPTSRTTSSGRHGAPIWLPRFRWRVALRSRAMEPTAERKSPGSGAAALRGGCQPLGSEGTGGDAHLPHVDRRRSQRRG